MKQGFHRILIVSIILLLAVVACNAPSAAPASSPIPSAPTSQPTPSASEEAPTETVPSILNERPLIWFAPLPPMQIREGRPFIGSDDFMDLFTPDAPWETAASHVGVFKLYGEWLAANVTDAELEQVVADLERRGIAIAYEGGPLPYDTGCGEGIEGFAGITEGLKVANQIRDAGGEIRYIAFDEPFAFGHIYDGPNACQWPLDRIARETARYVEAIQGVFPDAIAGDIEPLWAGADLEEYKQWMLTYEEVTGAPLPFFHLDVDFTRPGWEQDALELEQFARAHGVEFGMIYFGDWEDTSDEQWIGKAQDRITSYEALTGGRPDQVIIQSWHDHPDRVLPETTPNTFTWFLNRYFRTRTVINLQPEWIDDTSAAINGTLTQEDGTPVAGQSVAVTVSPLDGSGVPGTYTVTGIVPDGANHGNVGIRVNMECDCSASSEFSLYEVRYSENGGGNLVPNPNFAAGLNNWGSWGSVNPLVQPSDQGSGSMLYVTATPGQSFGVNGGDFPVTPGASFELTFTARVAPESVGSGYFAVFFLTPSTEVLRVQLPLEPAAAAEVSATTGSDGSFSVPVSSLPPGSYRIDASFEGDDQLWPALTQVVLPPR